MQMIVEFNSVTVDIPRYDEILETIKLKIGRQYFSNCYTHMAIDDPKV